MCEGSRAILKVINYFCYLQYLKSDPHSGCSEAIVPTSSLHFTTIAVFDPTLAITYLLTTLFKINGTDRLVNSSHCHISSLEVYRGRDRVIEISHQGFSLRDNGSIEVCRLII